MEILTFKTLVKAMYVLITSIFRLDTSASLSPRKMVLISSNFDERYKICDVIIVHKNKTSKVCRKT